MLSRSRHVCIGSRIDVGFVHILSPLWLVSSGMSHRLGLSALLNPVVTCDENAATPTLDDVRPQLRILANSSEPVKAPPHVIEWLMLAVQCLRNGSLDALPSTAVVPSLSSTDSSHECTPERPERVMPRMSPTPSPSARTLSPTSFPLNSAPIVQTDIKLNRKTTLSTLYRYEDIQAYVEYPETHPDDPVGYLFRHDPNNWLDPARDFAYSLGSPSGRTKRGDEVTCHLLHNVGDITDLVPCVGSHYTCM